MNLGSLIFPQRRSLPIKLSVIPFNEVEFRPVGEVFNGQSVQEAWTSRLPFAHGKKVMLGFRGVCHIANAAVIGMLRDAYRAQRQWRIDMPRGSWPIRMPFVMTEFEQGQNDERSLVRLELWSSTQYWPATHAGPAVNVNPTVFA